MLTRFVRIQLVIFTIVGTIGVIAMVLVYIQAPMLLGIGRITVTLELPAAGGLYEFANVTYRGVQLGKVTSVELTPKGAKATLSLETSPHVPADFAACPERPGPPNQCGAYVLSVSAVGEQYVDLRPRTDSGPYLHDGSVITVGKDSIPTPVGPMLEQVNALVGSIPKTKLGQLLDETFKGFNGSGYDLGSLFDSTTILSRDANGVVDRTKTLTEDTGPLLDSQARTTDSIRKWARGLAGISEVVANDDSSLRTVLRNGPDAANEASRLLDQIKPTLPILLANLTTIGQIGVTYHASLEQLLVLLPSAVAIEQAAGPTTHPEGSAQGDFALTIDDPPICTVGFVPASQWRSPDDLTDIDTPDGLYCKLPQDSPLSVRGARNYPCMGHPGKRAPTVEICDSDQPFMPLSMRQHVLGPSPIDPNLIAQGVPLDDRVNPNARTFGPVEGTPLPPGAVPRGTPPGPRGETAPPGTIGAAVPPVPSSRPMWAPSSQMSAEISPIAPLDMPSPGDLPPSPPPAPSPPAPSPPPGEAGGGGQAAPSSFGGGAGVRKPSVVVAHYDPRTGRYVGPDGKLYEQSDLASAKAPKNWKEMLPT